MANISVQSTPSGSGAAKTQSGALVILTSLFFMWGFVTVLNDILVPHLKGIFDLSYAQVMLIQFAFFSSYFIFSLPSAKLIEKIGYKMAIIVGLLTMGVGAWLFIPAASAASYPLFLGALMVLAAGITVLQVAANPYVAVIGPPETASSRLNLTQAFNSLGTTIGPWVGGLFILSVATKTPAELKDMSAAAVAAYRAQEASTVKLPYLLIGILLVLIAVAIWFTHLPRIPEVERQEGQKHESAWKYRHLILGIVGIFVYVGAEVAIGSFLINYFAQPNIGNMTESAAAKFVSYYWGGAMVGRFIGSAILQKVKAGTVLGVAGFGAAALVCISMLTTGHVAMWSIILVGFCNSIQFPSIFTLGIAKLGPMTGKGSGLLIMAIVGGAIIPVVQGFIADRIGIHHAFILPVLCYIYIAYYGFKGSQPTGVEA